MAKRLRHVVDDLQKYNRIIANAGCGTIDRLRSRLTPELLDDLQRRIVQDIAATERQLRALVRRKTGRTARLRRLARRAPNRSSSVGEHNALLSERERLLRERCELLRELGDACAWIILRKSARIILPLYAERHHPLPEGSGLAGPLQIMHHLHASGRFLAIDADTTNCLGQGDLVVVGVDGKWRQPMCFEIKSSEALVERGIGQVRLTAAISDDPDDLALHEAVATTLGLEACEFPAMNPRVARQENELIVASELLVFLSSAPIHYSLASQKETWRVIQNVLERAVQGIIAFDISEPGIAYVAAPKSMPRVHLDAMRDRMLESGFAMNHHCRTTDELHEGGRITAIVPPIALWPIPKALRVALLSRAIDLACVFSPAVWEAAAAAAGIEYRREKDRWLFGDTRGWARFDPVESRVLQFGLAFGGVSPRGVVRRIAEILTTERTTAAHQAARDRS